MRRTLSALSFVAALLLVPAFAVAAQTKPAPAKTDKAAPAAATHATSGIVRSTTATALVIAKTATATATETFVLNPATARKGDLAVGARVEVRYRAEGGQNIATAVTAAAPKGKSTPKSSK
jgi:hypothetical protein